MQAPPELCQGNEWALVPG